MDPPPSLAALRPPGSQFVAAFGVVLAAPAQWNPILLRAKPAFALAPFLGADPFAHGMIALADLRGTTFEVRWRTCRSPSAARQRLQHALKRADASTSPIPQFHSITPPESPKRPASPELRLITSLDRRVYELSLPGGISDLARPILESFLALNHAHIQLPQRFWSLYGAQGLAPSHARLKKLLLSPGQVQIALASPRRTTSFGSHGLANILLAPRTDLSLQDWSQSQPFFRGIAGQWTRLDDHCVSFSGTQSRLLRRRSSHQILVRHSPDANRISWIHTRTWGWRIVLPDEKG